MVEDPAKGAAEPVRLELNLVPGWATGRSMKPPKPAVMQAVPGRGKVETLN